MDGATELSDFRTNLRRRKRDSSRGHKFYTGCSPKKRTFRIDLFVVDK
jgi:hypothetical protein